MMAPKLLRELKGVNFSCTSPSSTTTDEDDHYSMVEAIGSSGRAIDRFSPHLRDPLRVRSLNPDLLINISQQQQSPSKSKSKPSSYSTTPSPKISSRKIKANGKQPYNIMSTTTPSGGGGALISPATSSRYLLDDQSSSSDDHLFEFLQQPAAARSATVNEAWRLQSAMPMQQQKSTVMIPSRIQSVKVETKYSTNDSATSSSSSSLPQNQQVVVLRVSLHCKGCEGKVRKHISKMEGVTSFSTDLVNKKVTVIGDVTPLGVLNSISKVKNAQLWPPTLA